MRKCEKNVAERNSSDDNVTQHMRISCWITKATNTHSQYIMRGRKQKVSGESELLKSLQSGTKSKNST